MTIDTKIQQLNKQDFLEYLHQLQILAKEKYSFDIFIENRLSQVSSKDIDEIKQTPKPLDKKKVIANQKKIIAELRGNKEDKQPPKGSVKEREDAKLLADDK